MRKVLELSKVNLELRRRHRRLTSGSTPLRDSRHRASSHTLRTGHDKYSSCTKSRHVVNRRSYGHPL